MLKDFSCFSDVSYVFNCIHMFQSVSTCFKMFQLLWFHNPGSDFSVGTLHMTQLSFVFLPLWTCWLGLYVGCILFCMFSASFLCRLILKHFEALSTPAQPTGHSPAAGSTWQVKAVVFAAHLPSSLLYCLLAALKIGSA
jgi:hypothetical protein